MSITISNCYKICNSPNNKSRAKMLYSFSKAPRFPKTSFNPCDRFYQINKRPQSACRATSLGYDKKYDFTKDLPNSPPPNMYNIKTTFEESMKKKKGYCFGSGRQQMQNTGPLSVIKTNKNPGPGSYEAFTDKNRFAITLSGKFDYQSKEPLKVPGPGTYQTQNYMSSSGKRYLSKYRNSPSRQFSKSCSRFFNYNNKLPGPGSYDMSNTSMSAIGNYNISKLHNSKARKFTLANRDTSMCRAKTPGPGNYELPSEFGHYISKDFYKKQKVRNSEENKQNIERN